MVSWTPVQRVCTLNTLLRGLMRAWKVSYSHSDGIKLLWSVAIEQLDVFKYFLDMMNVEQMFMMANYKLEDNLDHTHILTSLNTKVYLNEDHRSLVVHQSHEYLKGSSMDSSTHHVAVWARHFKPDCVSWQFLCFLCTCVYVCISAEEGLSLFVGPGGSTALGSQHTRWVWLCNRGLRVTYCRRLLQI